MWQAFESSIQTINRARRLNQSLKKSSSKQNKNYLQLLPNK
jgi:hypothetical protein